MLIKNHFRAIICGYLSNQNTYEKLRKKFGTHYYEKTFKNIKQAQIYFQKKRVSDQ